jgi:hypothetical protein
MLYYHQVAHHVADLSKNSPLFEHTGQMPNEERSSEMVCSYLSVHEALHGKAKMYSTKYSQFVIDYAVEWDRVVNQRVLGGLKKESQLRVEVDHYQEKVESMRVAANSAMVKGKMVDPKTAERLTRNEQKLVTSKQSHGKFLHDLCLLIEEITERAWRDLHPLLVKVAQFDVTLSDDESKALAKLNQIVNELKRLATTHGIKPQARLKDLDNLDPSLLSTKQADANNMLENGSAFGTLSLQTNNNGGLSPSSGGVASPFAGDFAAPAPGGYNMSRENSFGSSVGAAAAAPPSTQDMLAISASAAPPPTMDQITGAFGSGNNRSAPNNGALPPLGPGNLGRGRNLSQDSVDSGFSGYSGYSGFSGYSGAPAPPPAAPPPPPPPNNFGAPMPQSLSHSYNGQASNTYGAPPLPPGSYHAPAPNSHGMPPIQPYAPAPSPYGGPSANMYSNNSGGYGAPPDPPSQPWGQQNYSQTPSSYPARDPPPSSANPFNN